MRGGPLVSGHTASVLDFDFNPFHEQVGPSGRSFVRVVSTTSTSTTPGVVGDLQFVVGGNPKYARKSAVSIRVNFSFSLFFTKKNMPQPAS